MKRTERFFSQNQDADRWLVVGAAGFLGRAISAELSARKCDVLGAGRSAPSSSPLPGRSWRTLDVFDAENLRDLVREWRPTVLINALGHSPATSGPALKDFYVQSTRLLLETIQTAKPDCRVVLLGSAAEYGNALRPGGSLESDPARPLSEYGRAKCAQFECAESFSNHGLAITTARLFNPVGPGQGRHLFAASLMERIRRGERSLRVHSANHVRDWIDVRDAARALVTLAGSPQPPSVLNICTGIGETVGRVATEIGRLAGVELELEPGETTADVLWHSLGDPARMFQLGWRPQHGLSESLADQWRHFL